MTVGTRNTDLWFTLGGYASRSSYILGRVSVFGKRNKFVLQKILGGHFGC